MSIWLARLLGYGFSVVVGHFLVKGVVDRMRNAIDAGPKNGPRSGQSTVVGVVERALYTSAMEIGRHGFVGIWLALKVAAAWKQWDKEAPEASSGRATCQIFLVGSGLSVAYGAAGWKIIDWVQMWNWQSAVGMPLALVLGSLALLGLIGFVGKTPANEPDEI